jgi:predicted nucleotidyltransferase
MPLSSPNTAGATCLDEPRRREDLRRAAERAAVRMSTIARIVLFGSVATGPATPSSDADLRVVVATTPSARARHDGAPLIRKALSTSLDRVDVTEGKGSRP